MDIEDLVVSTATERRLYGPSDIIQALDGGASRTTMTASYRTDSITPTVYYTALYPDGTVLTDRTADVSLTECGDYIYEQPTVGVDQFVAIWDEGAVDDFILERIVVDV
jgi:hypothetical protein